MVFPPFLDIRRNPAFAYDYIINREVNGQMTGRLQIGNVVGICLTNANGLLTQALTRFF